MIYAGSRRGATYGMEVGPPLSCELRNNAKEIVDHTHAHTPLLPTWTTFHFVVLSGRDSYESVAVIHNCSGRRRLSAHPAVASSKVERGLHPAIQRKNIILLLERLCTVKYAIRYVAQELPAKTLIIQNTGPFIGSLTRDGLTLILVFHLLSHLLNCSKLKSIHRSSRSDESLCTSSITKIAHV